MNSDYLSKYNIKIYLIGAIVVMVLILLEWIIYPPFFKTKDITVTDVQRVVTKDLYKNEKIYYNIYYTYTLKDGTEREGRYKADKYIRLPDIGDKLKSNVRVSYSEGKFNFLSGLIMRLAIMLPLLHITTFIIIKLFDFIATRYFLYIFLGSIIISVVYVWYILNTPPIKRSFLENFRVVRVAGEIGFQYNDNMSSFRYTQLAYIYREDLKNYYKPLTSDEQKLIWDNFLEIYKLQNSIKFILLLDKQRDQYYNYNLKTYKVDGELTKTYYQLYKKIKLDFTTLPNIKFDMKNKYKYSLIQKHIKQTYILLQENRKYKK
jgi:hypothetical protein